MARKFVKTVVVKSGESVPAGLQPGQWIRFQDEKKAARFVAYGPLGTVVAKAPRDGKVSTAAFRLARHKNRVDVLGTVK